MCFATMNLFEVEMGEKKEFSEKVKLKALLWSNRRCCICDKPCGLDIEVAHIDPEGGNGFKNAIPVCYLHHAQIGRYNEAHPRGNKYRIKELTKRREQIYEKYTRHLIPPLNFYIVPRQHDPPRLQYKFPRVGFIMENPKEFLPATFKVNIKVFLGGKNLGSVGNPRRPYYSNGIVWNLNAGHFFTGNFTLPKRCVDSEEELILEANVVAIDQYERSHELLLLCFNYVRPKDPGKNGWWYTEPTSFSELKKFMYPKLD